MRRVHLMMADAPQPLLSELAAQASAIITAARAPLRMVVAGPYNSGKSTLLNAFLKSDVMPTNVIRETVTVNCLVYGEEPAVELRFKDRDRPPERVPCSAENIRETLNRVAAPFANDIERVHIQYPLDQLKNYTIIDTPGLDFDDRDTANAMRAAAEADVLIWLTQFYYANEHDALKKLKENCDTPPQVVGLINYIDVYEEAEAEELVADIHKRSKDNFDLLLPISALLAFEASQQGDTSLYDKSRFGAFRGWLYQDVFERHQDRMADKIYQLTRYFVENSEQRIGSESERCRDAIREAEEEVSVLSSELLPEAEAIRDSLDDWWKSRLARHLNGNGTSAPEGPAGDGRAGFASLLGVMPAKDKEDAVELLDRLETELGFNRLLEDADSQAGELKGRFIEACRRGAERHPEYRGVFEQLALHVDRLGPIEAVNLYVMGALDHIQPGDGGQFWTDRLGELIARVFQEFGELIWGTFELSGRDRLADLKGALQNYTSVLEKISKEKVYLLEDIDHAS